MRALDGQSSCAVDREIGVILYMSPDSLFADKPAGDLDARGAAQMLQILWQLNRGGTTVVMADEVFYLTDGLRIEGWGGSRSGKGHLG